MTPTNKLRFVERATPVFRGPEIIEDYKRVRVLQQWWTWDIEYPATKGEWRDVPLEKEQ